MGGKSKNVPGVGVMKMFPKDVKIDLFMGNVIQQVAFYKTIDPAVLLPRLLDIKKNFNPKLLAKFYASNLAKGSETKVDEDLILAATQAIDPLAETIVDTVRRSQSAYYMVKTYMFEYYGLPIYSDDCRVDQWNNGTEMVSVSNEQEVLNFLEIPYEYQADMSRCVFVDPNWEKEYIETVSFPLNESAPLYVIYTVGAETKDLYIWENDTIITVPTSYDYLTMNYKIDGEETDNKYRKVVDGIFGLSDGTLEGSLNDDDIKDFFLTYAAEWTSDKTDWQSEYDEMIRKLMGYDASASVGYEVNWDVEGFAQSVRYEEVETSSGTGYRMYINDERLINGTIGDEDFQRNQYMIPLNMLWDRTMREQYNDLKVLLTFFAYAVKKVKVKWYQTWLFQALMWVIAVVMAAHGSYGLLVGMLAGEVMKRLPFSAEIKQALGIVIGLLTQNWNQVLSSTLTTISFVADIASKLLSLYFRTQIAGITDEIKEIGSETKEVADAIAEMARQTIYAPMDAIDDVYDSIYNMVDKAYDEIYNYDAQVEVNVLTNYEYKPSTLDTIW